MSSLSQSGQYQNRELTGCGLASFPQCGQLQTASTTGLLFAGVTRVVIWEDLKHRPPDIGSASADLDGITIVQGLGRLAEGVLTGDDGLFDHEIIHDCTFPTRKRRRT